MIPFDLKSNCENEKCESSFYVFNIGSKMYQIIISIAWWTALSYKFLVKTNLLDGHASYQHNASFMIVPLLLLAFLFSRPRSSIARPAQGFPCTRYRARKMPDGDIISLLEINSYSHFLSLFSSLTHILSLSLFLSFPLASSPFLFFVWEMKTLP